MTPARRRRAAAELFGHPAARQPVVVEPLGEVQLEGLAAVDRRLAEVARQVLHVGDAAAALGALVQQPRCTAPRLKYWPPLFDGETTKRGAGIAPARRRAGRCGHVRREAAHGVRDAHVLERADEPRGAARRRTAPCRRARAVAAGRARVERTDAAADHALRPRAAIVATDERARVGVRVG